MVERCKYGSRVAGLFPKVLQKSYSNPIPFTIELSHLEKLSFAQASMHIASANAK